MVARKSPLGLGAGRKPPKSVYYKFYLLFSALAPAGEGPGGENEAFFIVFCNTKCESG